MHQHQKKQKNRDSLQTLMKELCTVLSIEEVINMDATASTLRILNIPEETVRILKRDGILSVDQLESLSYDQLRGLDGMSEKRCRTVIIRMAENDAYLRECDKNRDTKKYIVSLLKDYYEGRLRGIALRFQ